jgi:hypothetical protein
MEDNSAGNPSAACGADTPGGERAGDLMAVRPAPGAEEAVAQRLRALCHTEPIPSRRLLVARLPGPPDREAMMNQLQDWVKEGLVEFATPVIEDGDGSYRRIPTDEITVRFKSPAPEETLRKLEEKYGVKAARQNEFVPNQYTVHVPDPVGSRPLEVAQQINAEDTVEFAEPNYISEFRR